MSARLTVHFPFQPTRTFPVPGERETVIGRDPACDIVLDDERVSRRHARLVFADSAWKLFDLDSTNGTSLQGLPTREAALGNEGWISFGGLLARFEHPSIERERQEARRREERYRTSISLQRELSPSLGLDRLLDRVLSSVLQLSGTERGFVLLSGDNGAMDIAKRRNLADPDLIHDAFTGSVGAIERAVTTARPVAVSDALVDPHLQGRESVISGGIRALVCVPLEAGGRMIGLIYADSSQAGATFSELDVEILEALASHAALAIVMARVDRELSGMAAQLPYFDAGAVRSDSSWSGVLAHHRSRSGQAS
jgi:hypothetical protein